MLSPLLNYLNAPFPDHTNLKQQAFWLITVGVFIAFVSYLSFKPSPNQSSATVFSICIAFGAITVIFGGIFAQVRRRFINIPSDVPSWTLWKWITETILLVCWIAFGNFLLLKVIYPSMPFNIMSYLSIARGTLIVGIFPIVVSGLLIQLRALKINQALADGIVLTDHEQQSKFLEFVLSKGHSIKVDSSRFLYAESMHNYVSIHFFDAHGQAQSELLRNTLANILELTAGTNIVRSHRSFLVNLDLVEEVNGNAQGLKLGLSDLAEVEIPVSRAHIKQVKQHLDTLN
jgi:hypothetical protein